MNKYQEYSFNKLSAKFMLYVQHNIVYGIIIMLLYSFYPVLSTSRYYKEMPIILATSGFIIYGLLLSIFDNFTGPWYNYKLTMPPPNQSNMPRPEIYNYSRILPRIILIKIFYIGFYIWIWIPYIHRGLTITLHRPHFLQLIIDNIMFYIIAETLFTLNHWLLHREKLFKEYHLKHHKVYGSMGISGWYLKTFDLMLTIVLPIWVSIYCQDVFTVYLCYYFPFMENILTASGCHWLSVVIYLTTSEINNIHNHGGYNFPFMPSAGKHHLHHQQLKYNMGATYVDKPMKTYGGIDKQFRSS